MLWPDDFIETVGVEPYYYVDRLAQRELELK